MKAILIDPHSETISEVVYDGNWQTIGPWIDADLFDVVQIGNDDVVYVDDEGLFRDSRKFFWMKGWPHPLCGKGLVLGDSQYGETEDAHSTVEELRKSIKFMDALTVGMLTKTGVFQ
jgi:hypothetical protein